ncbi:hypothetical protein PUN28_011736 [Cardiocondyla obscurior]|uniref:Odorant receptor n=1 Tax=Cardiocondyla obscurior TaxID=286306 RepID=A0AAW2FHC6_9HYME
MDFQSVNPLNVRINLISGNLFPMTTDNTRFPVVWKIYSAFVWFVISVIVIGYFFGLVNVSKRKAISDGMIGTVFIVEVFFMVARIHMRKNLVLQLIQNMNEILRVQDETMRRTVIKSLKLMHSPFKFYWLSGAVTAIIWIIVPVGTVFKRNFFFYEDYRLPFAISKQPFSTEIFLIGNLLLVFCSVYVLIKKAAVDIYMLNFVMLMTAQYQYISLKLKEVLRKEYSPNKLDETKRTNYSEIDFERKMEIKRICRHHSTVIRMSAMLKELLSLSFSLIYVNNILRFSFVGVMLLNTVMNQAYSIALLCLKIVKK